MTPAGLARVAIGLILAMGAGRAAAAEPVPMADELRAVAHQRECRITTIGRKTGRPHTVTIWFAVAGDRLYVATLDDTRDWVRNALATPAVTVDFGGLAVTGRLRDVTGTDLDPAVREALAAKYWIARIGAWFGQGPKRTFVIEDLRLAGADAPAPAPTPAS